MVASSRAGGAMPMRDVHGGAMPMCYAHAMPMVARMVASAWAGGAISLKGCRRGLRWPAGGLNTARRRWLGRVLLRWPAGGLNTARRRWLGRARLWWPAGGLNTTRWRWLGRVFAGVIACCASPARRLVSPTVRGRHSGPRLDSVA